ncbi:hypothetical protein BY458DRAFT_487371 [Sporodiniella umbellata]|nr:hypothetical protein BY458DRAFT_487371 [Sporodiniella umbellata]
MALRNIFKKFLVKEADISKDSWYLAAYCSLAYANRSQDIGCLYKVVTEHIEGLKNESEEEKDKMLATTTLRIQEAGIKSVPIIGFPKNMNTLIHLGSILPKRIKALLPDGPIRFEGSEKNKEYTKMGIDFYDKIYDNNSDLFKTRMYSAYPDLEKTCRDVCYPVYTEFSVLSPKETSVVLMSSNMIQNTLTQYNIHHQGLLNNGATKKEVENIKSLVAKMGGYYDLKVAG